MKIDLEQAREAALKAAGENTSILAQRKMNLAEIFAAYESNLAAQMEAAGVKCIGREVDADTFAAGQHAIQHPFAIRGTRVVTSQQVYFAMHDAAPCLFQTAVKGDG
ncbi:MAG: hypothetical protein AAFQ22_13260 [Pseudomonadota bacterium]